MVSIIFFSISFTHSSESKEAYSSAWEVLKSANGILVPGGTIFSFVCRIVFIFSGFGSRGTEGKILAAKYARENKVPYFGICLGFQVFFLHITSDLR